MNGSEDADPSATTDRDLLARVSAGDTTALGVLYDRHGPAAFGLALRIVRDRSVAEDVVQEAFLGAWRTAGRHDARRAEVRTWIMAIVSLRASLACDAAERALDRDRVNSTGDMGGVALPEMQPGH